MWNLQVTNLIMDDSPAKKFLEFREKYFENEMTALEIAVMKPPDMSRKEDRIQFLKALEELEGTSCSRGRDTTRFWYFAYEHFMSELGFGDSWKYLEDNKEVRLTQIITNYKCLLFPMHLP